MSDGFKDASLLASRVPTAVGVDARQREGFWTVHVGDDGLRRIEQLDDLDAVLDASSQADAVAFDIPIGHEDPTGAHGDGQRACEAAAIDRYGDELRDRLLPMPPPAIYEIDHFHEAQAHCEERGWPVIPKPIWHGRHRVQQVTEAAAGDERIVEIHPEVSFAVLNETQGGEGLLEHYGRGWNALYERLTLLHEAGLRPARSLGGVGRASPKDVIDATIAAWSAHRVATGQARTFPASPPKDPRTGRAVAFHA